MFFFIHCDCPNGHNIVGSYFEGASETDTALLEAKDRELQAIVQREITEGKIPGRCPTCRASCKTWVIIIDSIKEGVDEAEIRRRMEEGEDAEAAARAAAMVCRSRTFFN